MSVHRSYLPCEWRPPERSANTHKSPQQTHLAEAAGLMVALRLVTGQRERAGGKGPGLRGDQRFVIGSGVYSLPAWAPHPPSLPHRRDRYSVSTEVWRQNAEIRPAGVSVCGTMADVEAAKNGHADALVRAAEIVIKSRLDTFEELL